MQSAYNVNYRFNKRIILTQRQAIEIYECKPETIVTSFGRRAASASRLVAEQYGVSPKTVRDIWNRRTWVSATAKLGQFGDLYAETRLSTEDSEVGQFNFLST